MLAEGWREDCGGVLYKRLSGDVKRRCMPGVCAVWQSKRDPPRRLVPAVGRCAYTDELVKPADPVGTVGVAWGGGTAPGTSVGPGCG